MYSGWYVTLTLHQIWPTFQAGLAELNLWHLKHILKFNLINKRLFSLSKSSNLLFFVIKRSLDQMELCVVKNLKRMKLSCNLLAKTFVAKKNYQAWEKHVFFVTIAFLYSKLVLCQKDYQGWGGDGEWREVSVPSWSEPHCSQLDHQLRLIWHLIIKLQAWTNNLSEEVGVIIR